MSGLTLVCKPGSGLLLETQSEFAWFFYQQRETDKTMKACIVNEDGSKKSFNMRTNEPVSIDIGGEPVSLELFRFSGLNAKVTIDASLSVDIAKEKIAKRTPPILH